MKGRIITGRMIAEFRKHLILEERSKITVEKYFKNMTNKNIKKVVYMIFRKISPIIMILKI